MKRMTNRERQAVMAFSALCLLLLAGIAYLQYAHVSSAEKGKVVHLVPVQDLVIASDSIAVMCVQSPPGNSIEKGKKKPGGSKSGAKATESPDRNSPLDNEN